MRRHIPVDRLDPLGHLVPLGPAPPHGIIDVGVQRPCPQQHPRHGARHSRWAARPAGQYQQGGAVDHGPSRHCVARPQPFAAPAFVVRRVERAGNRLRPTPVPAEEEAVQEHPLAGARSPAVGRSCLGAKPAGKAAHVPVGGRRRQDEKLRGGARGGRAQQCKDRLQVRPRVPVPHVVCIVDDDRTDVPGGKAAASQQIVHPCVRGDDQVAVPQPPRRGPAAAVGRACLDGNPQPPAGNAADLHCRPACMRPRGD